MQPRNYSSSTAHAYRSNGGHATSQPANAQPTTYAGFHPQVYDEQTIPMQYRSHSEAQQAHNTAPYQSSSPTTSSSHHRYSRSGSNIQYFTGSNMSGSPASTSHEYYQGTHGVVGHTPGQPSADHLASVPRSGAFIPTPSEMMVPYPAYHSQQMGGAYNNRYPTQSHHMGMATNGLQGRTGAAPTHGAPANLPSPERYPCELCKGKTFSRSHDRKRHYETHHTAHPPVHLCRFCNKPFSRGDSLKRHQDNGCDGGSDHHTA